MLVKLDHETPIFGVKIRIIFETTTFRSLYDTNPKTNILNNTLFKGKIFRIYHRFASSLIPSKWVQFHEFMTSVAKSLKKWQKKTFLSFDSAPNRSLWYVQKVSTAMFWFVFFPLSRPSRSLDSSQRPARLTFRFSCDSAWTILCKDGPDRVYHQIDHIRRDGFESHKIPGGTPNFWLEKRRSTWNFRENFITMTQRENGDGNGTDCRDDFFLDSCKYIPVQLWEVTSFNDHFFKILKFKCKLKIKKHQIPILDHCWWWFRVERAIICSFAGRKRPI